MGTGQTPPPGENSHALNSVKQRGHQCRRVRSELSVSSAGSRSFEVPLGGTSVHKFGLVVALHLFELHTRLCVAAVTPGSPRTNGGEKHWDLKKKINKQQKKKNTTWHCLQFQARRELSRPSKCSRSDWEGR